MGTFRIIAAGIGVSLAEKRSILGPILFFVLYNIPHLLVRFFGLVFEYKVRVNSLKKMLQNSELYFKTIKNESFNRIIITGSGTSYHSGVQVRSYMEEILNIEVNALYPFLITKEYLVKLEGNVLLIGISQGGSSY